VFIIWIVTNGLADDVAVEDLKRFEEEIMKFVEASHPAVVNTIRDKKNIDDDLKTAMKEAVDDFKATRWQTAVGAAA
jgi:F-type H+-transporting ATPase subunit alpha